VILDQEKATLRRLTTCDYRGEYLTADERHAIKSLLEDHERLTRALTWIEHNVTQPVPLRCNEPPHHARNGVVLVARALSEAGT
jgi:hypothetical protein